MACKCYLIKMFGGFVLFFDLCRISNVRIDIFVSEDIL